MILMSKWHLINTDEGGRTWLILGQALNKSFSVLVTWNWLTTLKIKALNQNSETNKLLFQMKLPFITSFNGKSTLIALKLSISTNYIQYNSTPIIINVVGVYCNATNNSLWLSLSDCDVVIWNWNWNSHIASHAIAIWFKNSNNNYFSFSYFL